jgi:UDP-glucuronate 4-epimerase
MKILVTGAAGFIGFHLSRRLLENGVEVLGVDGMTDYYDVSLKRARLGELRASNRFAAGEIMLEDKEALQGFLSAEKPDVVVHLAAQAGVRYSLEHPRSYVDSNLIGTFNVLELARKLEVKHLLIASTSSVYGGNTDLPFRETQRTDHPLTFYAATKKATEDMAHCYAHLWGIPTTAFRFFTVYGPWGRPDMALFKFVRATVEGSPIDVYGHGLMSRDFTYVDDLVDMIARLIPHAPVRGKPVSEADSLSPVAPYRVVNIGGGNPVKLMDFIDEIERSLGIPVKRNFVEMQKGDVPETSASTELLRALVGSSPTTTVAEGIRAFVTWYRAYYRV